ncbi:MAG: TonB family protein [Betaproteobacteria bacterium]|nr:TonB family protein [Betaproteobacteria bacterium]
MSFTATVTDGMMSAQRATLGERRPAAAGWRSYNAAMPSEPSLRQLPPQLPEWRRSGPFFLVSLALHLLVQVVWPPGLAVAVAPPPLQVQFAVEARQPTPELLPVVSEPQPPPPVKPVKHRPEPRKTPPILTMSPEQQAPTAATPVVAAPPAGEDEPVAALAVAAAPAAGPVVTAARYDAAYLSNPEPKYPLLSRRLGEEGKVLLRVRVTPDGRASAVELEKSSNFARLDEAARQAVAGWRFVPARRGNEAVEASVIVPIIFSLEG